VQVIATKLLTPQLDMGGALFARFTLRTGEPLSPSFGISVLYTADDVLQSGSDVSVHLAALALSACPFLWRMGSLSLQPCGIGIGGRLHATDRVVLFPETVDRSWWSAGGLARLSWGIGGTAAIQLEAGATFPLLERRFVTVAPEQEVAATPTIAPFGSFGAALYF
jgi:hypothetical protein